MQIHITQLVDSKTKVAFLYDPIFVETGEKSYGVYWSRSDANEVLKQAILRHKEKNSVFHTFTFPLREVNFMPPGSGKLTLSKQKAWFYIGAHQWSVVDTLGDLWPLEGKVRCKVDNFCKFWLTRNLSV